MSIQTQIERISGTVADQSDLLDQALIAIQNKAAGGGGGAAPEAVEQATPVITVGADGKITASAAQAAGYVTGGTKTATKQLTTQAAQTITPGTSDKTIASGRYLTGDQTIQGDANLVAGNIKKGVSIFNVLGTFEGSSGGLPAGVSKIAAGSFTLPSDQSTSQRIDHDFGIAPDLIAVFADTGDAEIVAGFNGYFLGSITTPSNYLVNGTTYEGTTVAYYVSSQKLGVTAAGTTLSEDIILIHPLRGNFKGGTTYHWIACVFE